MVLQLGHWFLTEVILPRRGHVALSVDVLVVTMQGCSGHPVGKAKDAAKHPAVHWTAAHNKGPDWE